ncbi:hypothetical protein [Butyrivibrio sp. AC2005]|uniref:hypothetical protein n=1 Tax=Butyrivibrio sp. AC2005 TaxID=1280672 RepID=UPI0004226C24|nr:hypothetical protein [Butyrivibrio sp. AC2005]
MECDGEFTKQFPYFKVMLGETIADGELTCRFIFEKSCKNKRAAYQIWWQLFFLGI